MIASSTHRPLNTFEPPKESTQESFSKYLLRFGLKNKNIVVLSSDCDSILKLGLFNKYAHERHFSFGLSEADMVSCAAGLAITGKIPFVCSFAGAITGRAFDQIRNTVCHPYLNVKIIGASAGILSEEFGFVSHALEDIALMRSLPQMKIFSPADETDCHQIMQHFMDSYGPAYLRLNTHIIPPLPHIRENFQEGKGQILKEGNDLAFISTGSIITEVISAAKILEGKNLQCRIINLTSLCPVDHELILETARTCRIIITVEDHSVINGLGSIVSEIVSSNFPCRVERIGIANRFTESGKPTALLEKYGLNADKIAASASNLIAKTAGFLHRRF